MGYRLHIVSIGHKPPSHVLLGMKYYEKRLLGLGKVEHVELAPAKKGAIKERLKKEALLVQPFLGGKKASILLAEEGDVYSSSAFAQKLEGLFLQGKEPQFILGGAYGVSSSLKQQMGNKLSLSRFTMPHQLCKLVLLEQIYRALSILRNQPYHH